MPGIARVGDLVYNGTHSHNDPVTQIPLVFPVLGSFTTASDNVFVNSKAAVRVGDTGTHVVCTGSNTFEAKERTSATVFINSKACIRENDFTEHCKNHLTRLATDPDGVVMGFCSPDTFAE
jgi:uncharacterized Zn-binding protein involved in type VI secretion